MCKKLTVAVLFARRQIREKKLTMHMAAMFNKKSVLRPQNL
jgi:hypothetical protein